MTGWLFFGMYCVSMADQQALHDRGEPVPAVVVDVSRSDEDSSPPAEVQLADGTRHTDVQLGDEHPRPGDRTTVALDPERRAQPRLGPPPEPPDATLRNVGPAAAAGATGLATHLTRRQGTVPLRTPRLTEDTPPPDTGDDRHDCAGNPGNRDNEDDRGVELTLIGVRQVRPAEHRAALAADTAHALDLTAQAAAAGIDLTMAGRCAQPPPTASRSRSSPPT
ncbi:hypothetical protein [Kitasatospora purpeofusca]|uniref:hypothetical protein n=1 Tax=Kitasatospora purpeofusca TaxID=67352 RepID=UPI0038158B9A